MARVGLAVMAFGLLLDIAVHDLVSHATEQTVAGFPWSEHAAHFVVLVGMALVLAGIVRTGTRMSRLSTPQNRSQLDAVR